MMILLAILGLAFALSLCMMLASIFTAPEGFEDETGFHAVAKEAKRAGRHQFSRPKVSLERRTSVA
jgi:hypothetical protein